MCDHKRTIHVTGKVSDLCSVTGPDGKEYEGHPPAISGLVDTYRDYLEFKLCIDCGKVIDLASAAAILEALREDDDVWLPR